MLSNLHKYIKSVNSYKIEEYDDLSAVGDNKLRGQRNKRFVRFSSDVFGDLIKELAENPNCSYDTYINDLIKEGYIPNFISTMIKEPNNKIIISGFSIGEFKEIIANRILNFFGCTSTYDTLLSVDGKRFICSVDFMKYGEELYMLNTLDPLNMPAGIDLDDNVYILARKMDRFAASKNIGDKYDEEILDSVTDQYVYDFLVRYEVLSDEDYGFHNMGLIYNEKDNSFRLTPNFDLEYSFMFNEERVNLVRKHFLDNNFKTAKKYQRKMYEKFVKKFNEFISVGDNGMTKYEEIIYSVIGDNETSRKFTIEYGSYLNKVSRLIEENAYKKVK